MKSKIKKKLTNLISALLAIVMTIVIIPLISKKTIASASEIVKNQNNTCLGVSGIGLPEEPNSKDYSWSGSYVYLGTGFTGISANQPGRFRVLAKDSTAYTSEAALFLDGSAGASAGKMRLDETSNKWYDENSGEGCELRTFLNGKYISDHFSELEDSAIAISNGTGGVSTYPESMKYRFGSPVALKDDKVFLLDVADVTNPAYGFIDDPGYECASGTWMDLNYISYRVFNRMSGGARWLRTAYCGDVYRTGTDPFAGYGSNISSEGVLAVSNVDYSDWNVMPSLNLRQESIIFATKITDNIDWGKPNAEYTLTLCDKNLEIALPADNQTTVAGTTITVSYEITGINAGNANRVSVLILDGIYGANGAEIIYYDEINGIFGTNSSGTFELPSGYDLSGWGSDYYVYLLAEDINGEMFTDYSSIPEEIPAPIFSIVVNSGSADFTEAATGTTITLTANEAILGKEFDKWVADSKNITFGDENSRSTAFIMPSACVEVTATYKDKIFTVTVTSDGNGTASVSSVSGIMGSEISLSAKPNEGFKLKEWQVIRGGITIKDNKFIMGSEDVEIMAIFENNSTDAAVTDQTTTVVGSTDAAVTDQTTTVVGSTDPAITNESTKTVDSTIPEDVTKEADTAIFEEPVNVSGPYTYSIVSGADSIIDGTSDLVIEIMSSGDDEHCIDRFDWAALDGLKLTTGDQITVSKGSTIVTFSREYLKTLSNGKHSIVFNFTDNSVATTVTVINSYPSSNSNSSIPKTGEETGIATLVGISMVLVSMSTVHVLIKKRKKADLS